MDTDTDDQPSMEETMSAIAEQLFDGDEIKQEPDEASDQEAAAEGAEQDQAEAATEEGAQAEDDTPSPDADGEDGEAPDQGDDEGDGASEGTLTAPERWSAEDKEQFDALPREAQEVVLKRERDVEQHLTQKSQEIADEKRRYAALDEVIEPRKDAWAMNGMTPDQAVRQLFAISDFATRDPQGFVRWFAEQRGIDPQQLAGGDEPADPQIKALSDEVNTLKQSQQQQQEAQAREQQATIARTIDEFAADKDAHPYFEELQSEIAGQIQTVKAQNPNASPKEQLEQAYQKAVWANESTRAKELERQRKAEDAERRKKAQASADKAKKAAGTNVQSKGSLPGGEKPRSMEETMSEAYDRAVGA